MPALLPNDPAYKAAEELSKMGERLNERCPTCQRSWFCFPPVKIDGEDKVRCIECKDVFDASIRR